MRVCRERSDAADNRKLILQTAKNLFKTYGVSEVSMHQIAKTAGIGQGTLYRRYAHKGELCSDLMEDTNRALMEEIEVTLGKLADASPSERFGAVLDLLVDFIEEKSQLLIPLHNVYLSEKDSSAFFRSPIYLHLKDTISSLAEATCGPEEPNCPSFLSHTVLCSLSPVAYLQMRGDMGFTKEEVKQHYRKLFIRA
ncbi:TetR/AcrR family transcriptional regulator [Cohnella sp. AR92]|uniref:TetR/AcrR family transcriptional regulator n=1 Tax=Cohnella sp. AR92 TaxID=648716 RepID=UPI000F8CC1F5|nr:TetR/AcrR family transcriptional regulator [Cohnella sp. AR92]RUS46761.1 TetR/AcrR family transcriptional regulator [Cohnella sp. AR92]